MPRSDFDVTAYAAELLKEAKDLPPDKRAVVEEVLNLEPVKGRLADSVLRQSDYSRQTQEIAKKKEEYEKQQAELEGWYSRQLEITKHNQEEYLRMQNQLKAYQSQYGEEMGNTTQTPQIDTSKFIPQEVFEAKMKELQEAFNRQLVEVQNSGVTVMAEMGSISQNHYKEFNEPLDTVTLKNEAIKNGVPLSVMYENMVRDRRAAIAEEKFKQQIAEAEERGRRAAMSAAKFPIAPPGGDDVHPLIARQQLGDKVSTLPAWKEGLQAYIDGTLTEKK